VNKKKQKNFDFPGDVATLWNSLPSSRSFLVLFFKKEPLARSRVPSALIALWFVLPRMGRDATETLPRP
jgi:hypothetical protein